MFNWEGISEFVAVVEEQTFTAAAKRLTLSTAHISRQISALERRLGVKLFYRTTRKVSVTDAGQQYYHQCKPLLDGLADAERKLTNQQTEPTGRLKITAPVTYGEQTIAPALVQFALRYPKLNIDLVLTNDTVDVVEGNYDLAIRVGTLADSSLIARKLAKRQLHFCAAPSYIATHGEPTAVAELSQHNCLVGSSDQWRFKVGKQTKNTTVRGSLRCNNGRAILNATLVGIGLSQLPDDYVAPYLKSGQLKALLTEFRPDDDGIWAVYPHNRQLSPAILALLEHFDHTLRAC